MVEDLHTFSRSVKAVLASFTSSTFSGQYSTNLPIYQLL